MRSLRYFGPCRKQNERLALLGRERDTAIHDSHSRHRESIALRRALADLVDAVRSSGAADAVVSNDLGNAMEAAEELLRR